MINTNPDFLSSSLHYLCTPVHFGNKFISTAIGSVGRTEAAFPLSSRLIFSKGSFIHNSRFCFYTLVLLIVNICLHRDSILTQVCVCVCVWGTHRRQRAPADCLWTRWCSSSVLAATGSDSPLTPADPHAPDPYYCHSNGYRPCRERNNITCSHLSLSNT